MKKLMLLSVLLMMIVPLFSFTSKSKVGLSHKTDWLVGYFDQAGHTYEVHGNNLGSASGMVISMSEDGTPLTNFSGTWGTTYGPEGTGIGVSVIFRRVNTSRATFEGITYY